MFMFMCKNATLQCGKAQPLRTLLQPPICQPENEKSPTLGGALTDFSMRKRCDHSVAASATSIVTPGPMVEVSEMRFM